MVEVIAVLTRGGVIVSKWNDPGVMLSAEYLLEIWTRRCFIEKASVKNFSYEFSPSVSYSYRWLEHESDLIFVVIVSKIERYDRLDELVKLLSYQFLKNATGVEGYFLEIVDKVLEAAESLKLVSKKQMCEPKSKHSASIVSLDFSEENKHGIAEKSRKIAYSSSESMTVNSRKQASSGFWFKSFQDNLKATLKSKVYLQEQDLSPLIEKFRLILLSKNVGQEIVKKLCETVFMRLLNEEGLSVMNVSVVFRDSIKEALQQVLTPNRSVHLLREIEVVRREKKTYVISLVGVNGVGKSTSLSKLAYWLVQHKFTIMVAACDTFRSGAVEQLRTHCQRLKIQLFDRGYDKDPATVAHEAIKQADRQGIDIVLIDTVGRMQDNEPLMRSLAKLINVNKPDLVLFVGEALLGNEATIQLKAFERRLCDLSLHKSSIIDGIILSKFDTIDDKVGSALSMVYSSGIPILFVGCGQTYADLRTFSIESVIDLLLT